MLGHRALHHDIVVIQLHAQVVAVGFLPAVIEGVLEVPVLAGHDVGSAQGETLDAVVAVVVAAVGDHRGAAGHAIGVHDLRLGGGEHVGNGADIGVHVIGKTLHLFNTPFPKRGILIKKSRP